MSERFDEAVAELEEYFTSSFAIGAQSYDPDRTGGKDVDASARAMAEGDLSVLCAERQHTRRHREQVNANTATWRTVMALGAADRAVLERWLAPRNWSSERLDSIDPARPHRKVEKPKLDRGAQLREVMKREGSNRSTVGVALVTHAARHAFKLHRTKRAEACRRLHEHYQAALELWLKARAEAKVAGLPLPSARTAPVPPAPPPADTEAELVVFLEWEAGRRGEAPSRRLLEAVRREAADLTTSALVAYETLRVGRVQAEATAKRLRRERIRSEFEATLQGRRTA